MGKAYATRASRAVSKKEAVALQEEGFASMQSVFSRGSYAGLQGCGTAGLGGEQGGKQQAPKELMVELGGWTAATLQRRRLYVCPAPARRADLPHLPVCLQWTS